MKKRLDLSLVLPCYNEAGLFVESVRRIRETLDVSRFSYEIIFVDDASSDGTQELIRSFCEESADVGIYAPGDKNFLGTAIRFHPAKILSRVASSFSGIPPRALFHRSNQGRGKTVVDGIRIAKGTVVGYIDIDCEVSPVYIPQMVSLLLKKRADVVIGKRFYRTTPGSILREVLSRGYQWISDMMIGTGGLDTETGYKFFFRRRIVPIISKTKHPGWFWDTEIMVYAKRAGLRIVEVPVLFLRRFDKRSSVNIVKDTIEYLVQLVQFRKSLR